MADVIDLSGKKLINTTDVPEPSWYTLVTKNAGQMNFKGYLVVTGAFVGVGDEKGKIISVTPLEELIIAYEIDPPEAE